MTRLSLPRVLVLCAAFLALLAINQVVLSPWVQNAVSPFAGQILFMAGRVLGLVALAFSLTVWAGAERFRALSLTTLISFIDGVAINAFRLWNESRLNPEAFAGGSLGGALLALSLSFILFFPILLLFAFTGTELGKLWIARAARNTTAARTG